MPDTPAYLARDRAAYVGSHSFVLLIGLLALISAISFFHDTGGPAYAPSAKLGDTFQWILFGSLGLGGVLVIIGLCGLWLPVEAAGHVLICAGIAMNGVTLVVTATIGFDVIMAVITVVATCGCILFRLWALVEAMRLADQIHDEIDSARDKIEHA